MSAPLTHTRAHAGMRAKGTKRSIEAMGEPKKKLQRLCKEHVMKYAVNGVIQTLTQVIMVHTKVRGDANLQNSA